MFVEIVKDAIATEEITLHFQPICNLKTQKLCGFEALARWHRMPPVDFIPLIEQNNLSLALVRKQIGQIEYALSMFRKIGKDDIWISFNVGKSTLALEGFSGLLSSTSRPEKIRIEILESAIIDLGDIAVLESIKKLHVIIADDIGAKGFDPLSRFLGKEADYIEGIKIDGALILAIQESAKARAVTRSLINLAKECNLSTTAEWIENTDLLDLLISKGCDQGQGKLFGMPMPLEQALSYSLKN